MADNPMTAEEFSKMRKFIKPFSRLNVWVYKLTRGLLMGKFQGRPVILVSMTGAKTGKKRTIPLMYVPYKDGVIVVGSQGGAPKSPVWVKSIQQNPEVVVQYRGNKMELKARQADDAEKAAVWPTCVEWYAPYQDYQGRTDRNIPVFICEPR